MALVIAVVTLKGGVGKTTTAIALAEAAAPWAPVTVVDTDPLGSAVRWSKLAMESGRPLRCTVVGHSRSDLSRRLGSVAHGAAVVVIDGPPPAALGIARAAMEAADLVVMPTPPERAALDRIPATRVVAAGERKPAMAVLTMVRPGHVDGPAAVSVLQAWGVPVYDTELPLAGSVQRGYGQPPSGVLARYGIDLMTEIVKETEANG